MHFIHIIRVTLGPLYSFGPLGPPGKGFRCLVTPLPAKDGAQTQYDVVVVLRHELRAAEAEISASLWDHDCGFQ